MPAACGPRPPDADPDNYRAVVLHVATVVRQIPPARQERWDDYKLRVAMAFHEVQNHRPIPVRLHVPLPPEAVKAAQAGRSLHEVLKAAEPPPPQPREVRKKEKAIVKGTPAKTKIFG